MGTVFFSSRPQMIVPLLLMAFAGIASAQRPLHDATPPAAPLTYPMPSNRYAVQYQVGSGSWIDAKVYISVYGGTLASPYRSDSGYSNVEETSMSFVSIPASANAIIQLRVTNIFGGAFTASDHVSVRPSAELVGVDTSPDGTVRISAATGSNFAGAQFILWWNRGAEGGGIETLAFFLNPIYTRPTGNNVQVVDAPAVDSDNISTDILNNPSIDTLDFEGTVAIAEPGYTHLGYAALVVPPQINRIYLGADAWVTRKTPLCGLWLHAGQPDDYNPYHVGRQHEHRVGKRAHKAAGRVMGAAVGIRRCTRRQSGNQRRRDYQV